MKKINLFLSSFLILVFSFKVLAQDRYPIPEDKMIFNGSGTRGGRLILPLESNPSTFNPLLIDNVSAAKILNRPVYQGLLGLDLETFESKSELAKEFDVSDDGLTYTFVLRKGVRWSDGKPFSADDVIFTYKVFTDSKVLASAKELLRQNDKSFPVLTKINDYKIQFKLNNVNVLFKNAISAMLIIPKHIWQKSYLDETFSQQMLVNQNPEKFVSTGPYKIEKYVPDQRVVLKRNPYYYKFDKNGVRLPYFDKIIRIIVPDKETTFVKFRNGETDIHELKAEEADLLLREQKQGGFTVYDLGPSYNPNWITFNQNPGTNKNGDPIVEKNKLKLFSDKRFRQAISYAIDREGINKTLFHNRATAVYNFYTPGNKIWHDPNVKKYPFDLKKAKTLLKEIGLKDTNGDGILEYQNKEPVKFSIKTNSNNATRVQIGNVMVSDFRKIGLDANLNPVPFNSAIDNMYKNYDFDAIILGWGSSVPSDPIMNKSTFLSSGKNHFWHPNQEAPATDYEKQIDEWMYKNQSTLDMNERKKYFKEVQKIWGEYLPQINFNTENKILAIKNFIGNAKPVAIRPYFDHNIDELYDKRIKN